jgi:hypothetical protein
VRWLRSRKRIEWRCVSRPSSASSYLAGRDELQRAQSAPHVGEVVLEVLEGIVDGRLDFRGRGPRRAVGRDLGELSGHVGGGRVSVSIVESQEIATS